MVDPGTAMLIASAIAATAQGAGSAYSGSQANKSAKFRSKEMKRETQSSLFADALDRSAQLEASRLAKRKRMGARSANNMQDTSEILRGAFNI